MRTASFWAISTTLFFVHAAACSSSREAFDDDTEAGASSSSSSGGSRRDAGRDAQTDSGRTPTGDTCADELALYEECGFDEGVQCGLDGYVANCKANEAATDSAQRIAGRQACLGTQNCDPDDRKFCIYESYRTMQLDSDQDALVTHYCNVCEPEDEAACNQRARRFTSVAATDSVWLAAWELSPALVKAIDEQCIDSSAGGDAGSCYAKFDSCAGGLYIDALVDCAD